MGRPRLRRHPDPLHRLDPPEARPRLGAFVLPAGLMLGSAGLLLSGTLAAAVLLRAVDKTLRCSIERPAGELLYLPVPEALRPPAKPFIDTVGWRAGDGLAGLAVMALATAGGMGPVRLSLVTLPFAAAWLLLAARAHRRYVATLGEGLRQHRLDAERTATTLLDRDTTALPGPPPLLRPPPL